MKLSDLQAKDIVNINDGRRVGRIVDAEITIDGKITYLLIEERRGLRNFMSKEMDSSITFTQIKKIGSDVILVDLWYNSLRCFLWRKKY